MNKDFAKGFVTNSTGTTSVNSGSPYSDDYARDARDAYIIVSGRITRAIRFELANALSRGLHAQTPIQPSDFNGSVDIWSLRDPKFPLQTAIRASYELMEGRFVAFNSDLDIFGTGLTMDEAIDDFRIAVVEMYRLLKEEGEQSLGKLPLAQWRLLQQFIKDEEEER